jgi:hypothetical protein
MNPELPRKKKIDLALAIAQGIAIIKWARANDVPKSTAFRWARDSNVRAMVENVRRRCVDRAVGHMAKNATYAATEIVRLGKEAESESVRLSALRAVLSKMMSVSEFSGLETRIAELEERFHAVSRDEAS